MTDDDELGDVLAEIVGDTVPVGDPDVEGDAEGDALGLVVPDVVPVPDALADADGELEPEMVAVGEPVPLAELESQLYGYGALDVHGNAVVLFKGEWQLETCAKAFPKAKFVEHGA